MTFVNEFKHLFTLYKFLIKKTEQRPANLIIQRALLNKCYHLSNKLGKQLPKWLFSQETMCPNCFTFWTNGKFRLHFKKGGNNVNHKSFKNDNTHIKKLTIMVLKCLVCHKSTSVKCDKPKLIKANNPQICKNAENKNRVHRNFHANKLSGIKMRTVARKKSLYSVNKSDIVSNNSTCFVKTNRKQNKGNIKKNVYNVIGKRKHKKPYLTTINDLLR